MPCGSAYALAILRHTKSTLKYGATGTTCLLSIATMWFGNLSEFQACYAKAVFAVLVFMYVSSDSSCAGT
jgi:hypothetical protein